MKHQSGNALWFILIAIGLLGLLTITFSRSSKNNDSGDYEQTQIAASEILRYAKSLENAVQTLLAKGCSENEISFENNVVAGYTNSNSPAENSCHVFRSAGAGMTYQEPKDQWLDSSQTASSGYGEWFFSGQSRVIEVGTDCTSSAPQCRELSIVLPFLDLDICLSINTQNDINNPSDEPPQDSGTAFTYDDTHKFTGTNFFGNAINPTGNQLHGKYHGCFKGDSDPSGGYHFYKVLHAR